MVRMRSRPLALVALLIPVALALGAGPTSCWFSNQDAYHGSTGMQLAATGRFRVEQVDGVWWFVTPAGHPFFSAGVNNVSLYSDYAPALGTYPYRDNALPRYGSESAWADSVIDRMSHAGLNTIGAWSQNELFRERFPYTQILGFAASAPIVPGTTLPRLPELRDYFDPAFASGATREAEGARACANDPYCIGVYSDNELPWGPAFNQSIPFIDGFMKLPAAAPGKIALQHFFEERYAGDIAAFGAAWGLTLASFDEIQGLSALSANWRRDSDAAKADRNAFRGRVAERYFQVAHDALRAISPDLLILGARFLAFATGPETVAAAAPFVDVLSVNAYEWNDAWFAISQTFVAQAGLLPATQLFDDVDEMARISGKPILITEFGYRAGDVGLPNSWPPVYVQLATQSERADAYENYMDLALARPYLVGTHWFEYADQPATGRFDGEDNNWGFVNIEDEIYAELFVRMWRVHVGLYQRRAELSD